MFTAAPHPTLWHQERDQGGEEACVCGGGGLLAWSTQWTCWTLCYPPISAGDLRWVAELAGQALDRSAHRGRLVLASTRHLLIVTDFNLFVCILSGNPSQCGPNTLVARGQSWYLTKCKTFSNDQNCCVKLAFCEISEKNSFSIFLWKHVILKPHTALRYTNVHVCVCGHSCPMCWCLCNAAAGSPQRKQHLTCAFTLNCHC